MGARVWLIRTTRSALAVHVDPQRTHRITTIPHEPIWYTDAICLQFPTVNSCSTRRWLEDCGICSVCHESESEVDACGLGRLVATALMANPNDTADTLATFMVVI
jgi:hypothetical protein